MGNSEDTVSKFDLVRNTYLENMSYPISPNPVKSVGAQNTIASSSTTSTQPSASSTNSSQTVDLNNQEQASKFASLLANEKDPKKVQELLKLIKTT